ncbi:MAG: flagellar basal body P-ring protein FlgI [Phycisphaeraceae bacterium]|nr:flagellar basal body P-ring protein FlgI [Phycisphaerales bacterium]QOJ17798.1 MAG: flagellar basal body P-ring protein FlgI [Phycisphaeraceae bacterium]
MKAAKTLMKMLVVPAMLALGATPARATDVQDLARIKGHEKNILTGLGIVIGLNGTGDKSKDALAAARPMARLLSNLGAGVGGLEELASANAFAIVQVTMHVPAAGARLGDEIDVSVDALFNAKSLAGGRLVPSMLRLPLPDAADLQPLAIAEGAIIIEGDNPRSGVVRKGGMVLDDRAFRANVVSSGGAMTLVLHDQYASHAVASLIANTINDEFVPVGQPGIAQVQDARNIRILLPEAERANPASFIAAVMTLRIDPTLIQTPARVVVNERVGSIVITGNVQISPVAISVDGLSITTITPPPQPTPQDPQVMTSTWARMDTTQGTARDSARLEDLIRALEQLNIPARSRIAVLFQLRDAGALHAEIIRQ